MVATETYGWQKKNILTHLYVTILFKEGIIT